MPEGSFIDAILQGIDMLWPCYNLAMELVNLGPQSAKVGGRGSCPHCGVPSYFEPVGGPYCDNGTLRMVHPAQCQNCKSFILLVGRRNLATGPYLLEAFYPLGKPNDSVDEAVPSSIREDFAEALRCRWIKAYKATVTMCRRAIQSSVLHVGASDKKLVEQIDELAMKGKLTASLKDYAREVRLTGNDGAHPDKDGLKDVSENDADDIIAFTKHFFDSVYVTPARLAARKPTPAQTPPQPAQP
ncbi:MAG TPA: DUF4145 domain-containing protein [Candidatus Acidoferrales bacterium]|nr:DUF4145 domain-containing protein [Candidatus Acidoferrales bacterium]